MLRKVSKKTMLEGLSVFGMDESFARVSGVAPFRFQTKLEALPRGLRDAMEAFDLRARTQKPRDFASGMELE